ncbi:C39 family peptidase [Peterkaempfera griseoplana]|uniref:C39 family peptidase n=1 Tax=Peterkaempfera griseoplana TaxID=66896 RepID=UPI0006E1A146|nr:C39 family peptidase [Peterkaempfera griseoplana]
MEQAPISRRAALTGALAAAVAVSVPQTAHAAVPDRHRTPDSAPVDYHAWTRYADWHAGTAAGVRVRPGGGHSPDGITIDQPLGTAPYTDPHTGTTADWEYATWTSPEHRLGFGASELVASWNADTPPGTWIEVELQGTYSDGGTTPWYVMGRWAAGDADIRRTSVDGQSDSRSDISTDTFEISDKASGLRLASYRLRITLRRRPGSTATPLVRRLGAMASDIPDRFTVPASVPGEGRGIELAVPRYSQDVHKGQYPQYDNGGEAWCSPTSSEMVVEYWGHHPSAADLAWIDPSYADPAVCQAARSTYDSQYAGCGNWPFNAAYAASYGLDALVTRLRSLNDVERLIKAGIPVITSQSFLATELDGAGYGTSGHLMTLIGFTADGDVIANDPASADDTAVRHVYRRRQFENIWLRTRRYAADGSVRGGSGGIVYLYKSPDVAWPKGLGLS